MWRSPLFLGAIFVVSGGLFVDSSAAPAKPELGTWGVDLTAMDRSVKPGDDFFSFVNGAWLKTTVIPPERTNIGTFQQLRILSEKRMRDIVSDLQTRPYDQLSPPEKKLRDLYETFVDQPQIEANGFTPIKADLATIRRIKSLDGVARAMASIKLATKSVFNLSIEVDEKDSNAYSVVVAQSGLGMPDRDYYLSNDGAIVATRDAYKKYLSAMLALAGLADTDKRAAAILAVETRIAQAHWTRAENRDETKTYNPMTVSDLKKLAPEFRWATFLRTTGIPFRGPKGERVIVVKQKSAFSPLAKIFAQTPVSVWRDYLTVHYLHGVAPYLPKQVDDTNFAFNGTVLSGLTQQLDRPTRGVHLLDTLMGEALGQIYIAKYFPPEAKKKADELVANLLRAYDADIRSLSWMSQETRQKALAKLHKFTPHIGYPDKWIDYSGYQVVRGKLIADVQAGVEFEWQRELKRLDDPVDKGEWGMTPQTVNAYYNPSFNEVVFPAAILQPPFFDANADDAVNYGGIGAAIGHEISHGFDDQGSHYDGDGVLRNWWTDADRANFDRRTTALSDQFDRFEPLPGLHIIGRNTLGENIADLAGLTIALNAYHLSLAGKPAVLLDGYSGDQRFFLSYGQIWRSTFRDSALRTQVLSNEHSPAQFRVIGTTRNLDAWYDAFGAKPGEKYYLPPEQRVHLW